MAGSRLPATAAGALAPRRVPEPYVRAEVAAFPLTSSDAFRTALVALDPDLDDDEGGSAAEPKRATLRLWRACEAALVEHASGWSLDRIVSVRDHTWFGARADERRGPLRPVPMHEYLGRLANLYIEAQHGVSQLKYADDASLADAVNRYRWLNFAMPEDLLLAAVDLTPPPTAVSIEEPLLARRLRDHGVADIHQHVNAGLDFSLLWAAALAAIADDDIGGGELASPGMPYAVEEAARWSGHGFDELGDRLLRWLLVAGVMRIVLAKFLIWRDAQRARGDDLDDGRGTLAAFLRRVCRPRAGLHAHDVATAYAAVLALTRAPGDPPAVEPLRHLYARLHPTAFCAPKSLEEVWRRCDPIAWRLQLHHRGGGERWLVRHGLGYLAATDACDVDFARAFWQLMRIRCTYYRFVVQRPLTAGLQWFLRFYNRVRPLRRRLQEVRPEAAYQVACAGDRIAALEVRGSCEPTATKLGEELATIVRSWGNVLKRYRRGEEPELGVIVEFVKDRDPKQLWARGRPKAFAHETYAEPQAPPPWDGRGGDEVAHAMRAPLRGDLRFAEYLSSQAAGADATAELLLAVPQALWLVRGVDVAADEIGVPTWVLVPLYAHVRRSAALASVLPGADGAPTLRTTAHVGEDFRHLMEGLRHVFETVAYLLGNAGGRLGHATALGVEPRLWGESVGTVLMPAEERLWDLVFEWRLYTGFHVSPELVAVAPPGREEWLANHIRDLASAIFDNASAPRDLAQLHHDLHRFMLPDHGRVSFRVSRALERFRAATATGQPGEKTRRRLLTDHLRDVGTFRRGQQLVDVTIDDNEVAALAAVQDALRCGVAARGIVVEVNPTSNLLIGDMLDLRHHPLLRLFPIEPGDGPPAVPIAVGSDDPITFSTSLLREYDLMYLTARAAGYPERVVHGWIELIRQVSMDSRFTLGWRPNAATRAQRLLDDLGRFLQWPRAKRRQGCADFEPEHERSRER